MAQLQLTGNSQAEAFRATVALVAGDTDRMVAIGRGWQGAQLNVTGGGMVEGIGPDGKPKLFPTDPSSYKYPDTIAGFTSFISSYNTAAAELGSPGYRVSTDAVARKLVGDRWDPSLSHTQNLINAGFLGRPGQTISVVRTGPTPAEGGRSQVTEVLAGYGQNVPQVGDMVDVGARKEFPPAVPETAVPVTGSANGQLAGSEPGGADPNAAGGQGGGLPALPLWVWLAGAVGVVAVLKRKGG
jgi:hypothetical protein